MVVLFQQYAENRDFFSSFSINGLHSQDILLIIPLELSKKKQVRNAFPHLRRILWNTAWREPRAIPSRTCAGNLARSHRRSEGSPYACGQSGYTQTIGIFTALAHTCGQLAAYAPSQCTPSVFRMGGASAAWESPLREFSKNSFYISYN